MTTGPDSPGGRSDRGEHAPTDAEALAEVFNRFTFRGNRRVQEHAPAPTGEAGPDESAPGLWPAHEAPENGPESGLGADHERPRAAQWQAADEETATYIRPYAWTGGRTKSHYRFELETLVETSELCQTSRLERLEHHSIAHLCRHPRSVAEVGAMLRVPLGVARVLLGDMAELGLITVHRTVSENGSTAHMMLMERVLSGLRRL